MLDALALRLYGHSIFGIIQLFIMTFLKTLKPSGPLVVGCTDIMIGRTKEGSLLRLFYPTDAKELPDESQWTRWYLGDSYSRGLGKFVAPWFLQGTFAWLLNWQTRYSLVPSAWCSNLLSGDKKLPVVVFSHGLGANRSMYSSVCCQLASHGFVVAALEHRDGSACSSFTLNEEGEKEWLEFELHKPGDKQIVLRSKQIGIRVKECQSTLTIMERLNSGGVENELKNAFDIRQLIGRLDLSRPIIAGHSFGGCAAINTQLQDKRFKLCVALDPWLFPMKDSVELCSKMEKHVLCVSTDTFQTPENLEAMSHLPSQLTSFVTIKGTVHQNQADTPFLLGTAGRLIGGTNSKLDHSLAMEINNALMMAFIHSHHGLPKGLSDEYGERWDAFVAEHQSKLVYGLYGTARKMIGWNKTGL
ncbi:platelet-activating factor acetylhydrolase isoform X2 [Hyalella azteca]|uniref:1-alkyl-2-acetylglycerophosphocholine esterase n=1 Tax=Hyalella azteca TaxID=294128 RepID=A0A8B7P5B3_HYAAZ|nr:platelet-activating factor acetylhydrolase isoform X2 [Hyalella azteca]